MSTLAEASQHLTTVVTEPSTRPFGDASANYGKMPEGLPMTLATTSSGPWLPEATQATLLEQVVVAEAEDETLTETMEL